MTDIGKALATLYFAKFPHDPSLVDEALAPDFVFHHLRVVAGPEAFRTFMADVSRAFPDFRFDVHHLIDAGELVAAHYTFSGTQRGLFMDVVPSRGKRFATRGMSLYRVEADRIAEIWVAFNSLSMMQQLGAVPELDANVERLRN